MYVNIYVLIIFLFAGKEEERWSSQEQSTERLVTS